jgi:putative transposase
MRNVTDPNRSASGKFQQVVAAFLTQPGLPFASVLSAERIERVFTKHGNLFGMNAVYSTAVMVWSFLSQVLRDGKEASCQAAVARIVSHREQADPQWLWKGLHAKLVDGFTFTMPDSASNRAEFPHPRTQKKGVPPQADPSHARR